MSGVRFLVPPRIIPGLSSLARLRERAGVRVAAFARFCHRSTLILSFSRLREKGPSMLFYFRSVIYLHVEDVVDHTKAQLKELTA
jgi:hypothetical protein